MRKVGSGGGNVNGKAVFQKLHVLYFRCILLSNMFLWREKVHENLKPCKVRKVKTQIVIF